jgi:hypothetical protein
MAELGDRVDPRLVEVIDRALVRNVGGTSWPALAADIAGDVWRWLEEGDLE